MSNNQQYDNEMRGVLFKQREKKSERSPDYTGNVTIGGVEYRLSGWARQGRSGTFLSLAVSKSENQSGNSAPRQSGGDDFLDEGIGSKPASRETSAPRTGQLTPEEIQRMGEGGRAANGKKPNDDWDDDIPFNS